MVTVGELMDLIKDACGLGISVSWATIDVPSAEALQVSLGYDFAAVMRSWVQMVAAAKEANSERGNETVSQGFSTQRNTTGAHIDGGHPELTNSNVPPQMHSAQEQARVSAILT
jgi:predicted histidine transporter YuiF (NhaC family)